MNDKIDKAMIPKINSKNVILNDICTTKCDYNSLVSLAM